MKRRNQSGLWRQGGWVLPVALVMIAGLAALCLQVAQGLRGPQAQTLLNSPKQSQQLSHIKSALIGFALTRGSNSQSQVGHLPCPSPQFNEPPPATCLRNPVGHLPTMTRSAINHLRLGTPQATGVSGPATAWQYAVSAQVIQANELGWSQWVNWSRPALRVQTPQGELSNVAAVVAARLTILGEDHLQAEGAYVVITAQELQNLEARLAKHQSQAMFQRWKAGQTHTFAHEFLSAKAGGTWQAKPDLCQCHCLKTQCECACLNASWWTSEGACLTPSSGCGKTKTFLDSISQVGWPANSPLTEAQAKALPALSYLCHAPAGQSCKFKGSARLLSNWPLLSTQPEWSGQRACAKLTGASCPLSTQSNACTCKYAWPTQNTALVEGLTFSDD